MASRVSVDEKLSMEELKRSLDSQLSVQVLAFTDANRIFGAFSDRDWAQSASRRIARLAGVWCCGAGVKNWLTYGMDSGLE